MFHGDQDKTVHPDNGNQVIAQLREGLNVDLRVTVQPGTAPVPHPGVLVITSNRAKGETVTEAYAVTENRDGGKLLGWRLTKADGTVYDLPADLSSCDCPDYVHNRAYAQTAELRACKHCKALKKALAEIAG